jgi:hypothetical protein
MIVADDRAYIGLLRVRGVPERSPAVRLRLSHLVGAADLTPTGMPAGATLVLRRLCDPLPGRLAPALNQGAVPSRDWERAAQAMLTECYHKAARPREAGLSSSADAVLFADPGELLAYLARDLLTGFAASRWWWAALLQALPADAVAALVTAFLREARFVPAALAHLSAWGDAPAVLHLFTPADAERVFAAVIREYDLVALASPLGAATVQPPIERPKAAGCDRHAATSQVQRVETGRAAVVRRPPWEPSVPRELVPDSLGLQARALLGVCLLLHRAPAVACHQQFATDFANWRGDMVDLCRGVARLAKSMPLPHRIGAAVAVPYREDTARVSCSTLAAPLEAFAHMTIPAMSAGRHDGEHTSVASHQSVRAHHREPPSEEPVAPGQHEAEAEVASQPALESSTLHGPSVETELGGVLFLINLMQRLGVPRDLERDFRVAYSLGAWGWLELLARCLLDRTSPDLAGDPIWKVLGELEGRAPGTPLPQDFVGQPGYRLPELWLSYLGSRPEASLELRRIGLFWQLWDPAGYEVIEGEDPPSTGYDSARAVVTISAEAERRAERRSACRPLGWAPPRELSRFLKFMLPSIRWGLLQTMALDEEGGSTLAAALLVRQGHLSVTATHVELTMALELATGPVRRAGLDVDPGWVPEFGRIVSFHYV